MVLWKGIGDRIGQFRRYVRITEADEIARRYFVMNAFDGSLTILGIVLGTSFLRVREPRVVIGAGVGASLAMGMSGFFGTYLTERAERTRQLKRLERAMVTQLDETVWDTASSFVSFWAAFVDGASPALTAFVAVIPFILCHFGLFGFESALAASLVLVFATLVFLGAYLGHISQESIAISGARMLLVGILTAFVIWLLSENGIGTAAALASCAA